jgi:threonine/homoserine/homoserine lactone efflux protein
MTYETLIALMIFAFTSSVTPGPNNMMLLASGVNFGFRKTVPHIVGIELGFGLLILAVGLGLGALFSAEPRLYLVLKVLGGAYLLWIAWHIATTRTLASGRSATGEEPKPLSFMQAALFQFVNPKAWVMAAGAVAAYQGPDAYMRDSLLIMLAFMSVGIFCTAAWAGFGTALKGWLADGARLRWFNITMAILLVLSLWPMLR